MVAGKAHSTAEYAKVAQRNSVCCVEGGAQNLVSLDSGDALRQGCALGDGEVVHHLVGCSVAGLETHTSHVLCRALLEAYTVLHICMH